MPERKKRKKRKKKGKKGKKKKKNYKISRRMLTSAPSIDVSLILLQCLGLRRRYARPSTAQHSPPPKKKIVSISVCTPPKKQFFSTMPQILQQMLCRGMVFRAVPAGFSVRPASPRLFFFFPFSSSVTQEQCFMRFTALSAVASRHTRSCHLRVAGRPSL